MQWIEAVLGRNVFGGKTGADNVHEVLKDGKVLVELVLFLKVDSDFHLLGKSPGIADVVFPNRNCLRFHSQSYE